MTRPEDVALLREIADERERMALGVMAIRGDASMLRESVARLRSLASRLEGERRDGGEGACVTCGLPKDRHSGPERFCPLYATYRTVPHPTPTTPSEDRQP